MSRVCVATPRFHFCTLMVLAGFALIGGRLFYLQVLEAERIAAEGVSVRERTIELSARRGDILDRNGDLLAGSRSRFQLGLDPQVVDPADHTALARLAVLLEIPMESLLRKTQRRTFTDREGRKRPLAWVPLALVEEDLYLKVEDLDIDGVYGYRRYERYYPGSELAAHLIGFINKEGTPVMGVERALDYYLKGQGGVLETEVDGKLRELAAFRTRKVDPRHGMNVQLTLDLYVQATIEAALKKLVAETDARGASVIVSDPRTGEILGLANHPTLDLNTFWDFPLAHQRNRAVSDQYEPGSTFKIVPVAAALEEGLVDPATPVDCSQTHVTFNGVRIPMPSDHRELGTVPVHTVVQKSSNRGAAMLAMQLGEERMYAYARRFGFGERPAWDLPGATDGSLAPVSDWDGYTISRLPTGYAIGATPLQVHLAMATLANDGVRHPLRLFQEVKDPDGQIRFAFESGKAERVVRKDTASMLKEMLVHVVSPEGTARRAEIPGYAVAGKTGTARKIINGQYSHEHHVASFSGFFPAPDPQVVITVVVDDARIEGPAYGGLVAAPLFREIGELLIPHLEIRKPTSWTPFIVAND